MQYTPGIRKQLITSSTMAFSKLSLSVWVVSISVLVQMAAGVVDLYKPVHHSCPSFSNPDENFTIGSQYEKNLDLVLYNLSIMTPPTGFAYGSAGVEENIDPIYGQAQCRADVSTADCKTCVGKIVKWIRQKCPVQKSAFAWFQGCLLKYSDVDLYGKIDAGAEAYFIPKKQNLSRVITVEKLNKFFVVQSEKAYTSEKLFAKGVIKLSGSKNLYGLVECTQDVSHELCKTCLDLLITLSTTEGYGHGTQFFQTVCTPCNFRSIYPFFNA